MNEMDRTTKIWDKFADDLRWFIRSKINDKSLAEDLLQDTFIKIHSNIDTLKEDTKLRGWIYQIARNTIIDSYRKSKPNIDEFPEIGIIDEFNNETPAEEIANSIREMIMKLPDKYSDTLCLYECEGMSQKNIAEKLNLSISGTKARIQRARKLIKDELMKCCHYEFDKYGTLIDYHPINCCCCNVNP